MILFALAFARFTLSSAIGNFGGQLQADLKRSDSSALEGAFSNHASAKYLFSMAGARGGLSHLQVALVPVPPGFNSPAEAWAIFHTFQDIEEDHDPVFEVLGASGGFRLGKEIPEDELSGWRIRHVQYWGTLSPETQSTEVRAVLDLKAGAPCAPLFRLNDIYQIDSVTAGGKKWPIEDASADRLITPASGSVVRAGSLLIPWTTERFTRYDLQYHAMVNEPGEDEVSETEAAVTAWWIPSLGRLPFTVVGHITGPKNWVLRGEGVRKGVTFEGNEQTDTFASNLPISYPKMIGGPYQLEAQEDNSLGNFRIYQLPPADKTRAKRDLSAMVAAAEFYKKVLGPLPFGGYECYDSDNYYGIESYSHTLLNRTITHFISHEMGHSYFGGDAPCTYVHDSWNEGLTQYIDSVVLLKDADHSLEYGLRTIDVHEPLSAMPVAHGNQEANYYRGCYVMKMLEAEIGLPNVLKGLRMIAHDRIGEDTRWDDLRQYFEKASGEDLGWYWRQWIDGDTFPTIRSSSSEVTDTHFLFHLSQSGTLSPFRLKLGVEWSDHAGRHMKVLPFETAERSYSIPTRGLAKDIHLQVFPFSYVQG